MDHLLDTNREAVMKIYGQTEDSIRADMTSLRDWLKSQPHIPYVQEDLLERMLLNCKFSIEACKNNIDTYFTLRTFLPEYFAKRDPLSRGIQNIISVGSLVPLKQLTPNYERVLVFKLFDGDSDKFDFVQLQKGTFMIEDLRLRHDYPSGNHLIADLDKVTLGHISKASPTLLIKGFRLYLDGIKLKIKHIHFVNPNKYLTAILSLCKLIFKPKIYERIKVHETMESLYEFVPKSILPKDYGGDQSTVREIFGEWVKEVIKNRDWFMQEEQICTNESKRPQKLNDEFFGSMHGSFRNLNVD